ncbi:MAG TPA: hypothetical protein EYH56_01395 [Nanoarchaeota archaeon]|nr:hypothetical protein [Nanoarchaeota archaeon]
MKKQKGALGIERMFLIFIGVIIVGIALFLVHILKFCSFGTKIPVEKPICGGFNLDVKRSYEMFQELPFKVDFAIYTFLKTKTSLPVDTCIKYIDCVMDTDEAICKKFYGNEFDNDTCKTLISNTLKSIWERKIKLTITNVHGKSITFIANEDKTETVNPLYRVQRKIFIPYPSRTITLTFEVW